MSKWIDFDMLMSELDLHRDNAARMVKAYKEIENPTEWDRIQCKEAVGSVVVSECIMAWCNDFSFSSEDVINIMNEENKKKSLQSAKKIVEEISMNLGLKSE